MTWRVYTAVAYGVGLTRLTRTSYSFSRERPWWYVPPGTLSTSWYHMRVTEHTKFSNTILPALKVCPSHNAALPRLEKVLEYSGPSSTFKRSLK